MFIEEHCWLFYNYYLSKQKATETKENKTARALFAELKTAMQIQFELLKQRQRESLKARYKIPDKKRIHGKSLLTLSVD